LEISRKKADAVLIEKVSDLQSAKIKNNITKLAVLAGASTPKELTMEVIYTMEQNNTPDVAIDVNPTEVAEEKVTETVTEEVKADEAVVETAEKPVQKKKKEITTMEEAMKAGFAPKSYRENQRVRVTVESVDQTGVNVSLNLGGKNDAGFIAASEMEIDGSFDPANYTVGETLEAIIIPKADAKSKTINLSKRKCDEIFVGDAAAQHILNGEDFKLKITSVTKGGLLGKLGSYTIFVPASQIRMGFVKNLEDYVGKELRLRMLPPKEEEGGRKPNPKRIVASQRVILEEEKAQREDEFWANVVPGAVVEGKVKRFAQKDGKYFGIFVSVFNKDCLLHISDLSWTKVEDPSEVLKLNETYNFLVLKADREADKVSLGYKQLQKTPYQLAAEKYHVGDVVKGTVARIKDFGAFISLEPGIDGLVHVSEISHNYIKSAADALKVGDEVEAKIINFEKDKITLSIKACQEPEVQEVAEKEESDAPAQTSSRIAKFHNRAQGAEDQPKRRRRDEERDNEVHEYYSSGSTGATFADLFKNIDLSNFPASDDSDKADK
ncbi:MAG TPA: S1 RNA-binding domain-containing protein, partial [Candidatus Stercoripulliclostridium merdigallinarum]|nr:S1 RNA-binding domain-containing protein [Candidatus Stercoripulliclostridium merdigallinarum]